MVDFLILLAIAVAVLLGIMKAFPSHTGASRYARNILIGLDQLINAILFGDPDETLSSHIGKAAEHGHWFAIMMSRFLDLFEKDHCKKSMEYDEGKRQLFKD